MRSTNYLSTASLILGLSSSVVQAQIKPIPEFFNLTTFPKEQKENVTRLLNEGRRLATDGSIHQYFQDQCITQQVYPAMFTMPPGFVNPFAAFDKFFFVGHAYVSAWAYDTGYGLVLIDALDNQDEIEKILVPDLEKLGYQGSDIKHLIITHEHIDHFGGAKYIQDQFNASVYAAEAAWEGMAEQGEDSNTPVPVKDKVVVDGDALTFGDVTFEIVQTPGHTPGTISLIFPVVDKGKRHLAGLSGGTGTPAAKTAREQKIASQNRFAEIAKAKGVDVLLSNHNVADHSLSNADILAHRAPGASNPYVVGVKNFYNYMRINALCSQVIAAREGMDLDV
ncbi:hypothetical protein BFJ70_g6344 [Fusarium oxysporum]|uniref:Metallo-beta-lactamase domain-containing protein n=1 Tax=Fusarium oxysporum TaxID=5507 RepID=A0A420NJ94_FUSOX|nr:hypothetical protein FOXYS1_16023 [Fusarium oxysporum]KAJ4146746.1 hypothetical protein NW765_016670 [Fusarium oxysporum]KAJ4270796.1 hypothetical protein NW764_013677 [Fusarium oxysporum]RKK80355.1 hypothetical protein BFJ71_g15952 [Fusarium oxysporum]RKK93119.1 hypothetical protein BFJ68_g15684 [Fusarium oxysporum]